PHGRAVRRARSDCDGEDRGHHLRPEEGLYGHHRDTQHAAGCARGGDDGLHVPRPSHRGGRDARAVREAQRDVDRKLHHREVWVVPQAAERKALQKGLQKLNENMVTLAELSELAIRKAIDSLTRLDGEVAREVLTIDKEVYGLPVEIDHTCVDLINRMADGDLKIDTRERDILVDHYRGRIADHAVNIGTRVAYMVAGDWLPRERAADRVERKPRGGDPAGARLYRSGMPAEGSSV